MSNIYIEILSDTLETLQQFTIISIDLLQTFDALDHTILLNKRYIYGIRSIDFNLIKSYLSNLSEREKYVSQNSQNSNYNNISCGVP